jgi:hypothetical protein
MASTYATEVATVSERRGGGLPRRPCLRASAPRPCRDRHHVLAGDRLPGPLDHFITPQPHRDCRPVHDIKHDLDVTHGAIVISDGQPLIQNTVRRKAQVIQPRACTRPRGVCSNMASNVI